MGNLKWHLMWLLVATVALIVLPGQLWLGEPFWRSDSGQVLQILVVAGAYLVGGVLSVALAGRKSWGIGAVSLLAALAPLGGAYFGLILLAPAYSRGVLLTASVVYAGLGPVNTKGRFVVYWGYENHRVPISSDRGLLSASARQCEHLQSRSA